MVCIPTQSVGTRSEVSEVARLDISLQHYSVEMHRVNDVDMIRAALQ